MSERIHGGVNVVIPGLLQDNPHIEERCGVSKHQHIQQTENSGFWPSRSQPLKFVPFGHDVFHFQVGGWMNGELNFSEFV